MGARRAVSVAGGGVAAITRWVAIRLPMMGRLLSQSRLMVMISVVVQGLEVDGEKNKVTSVRCGQILTDDWHTLELSESPASTCAGRARVLPLGPVSHESVCSPSHPYIHLVHMKDRIALVMPVQCLDLFSPTAATLLRLCLRHKETGKSRGQYGTLPLPDRLCGIPCGKLEPRATSSGRLCELLVRPLFHYYLSM